ncbi:energy transducer TonB [Hymenobacter baengnokdamensis]|uniref:energy transducer TonB n=1 Tax=Hymenobacter baengnokdamensis TaxID=2615203 RepID=UPI00124948B3|nr:energy transducer TonB [Hymenobacter baengnokdamensis]
MSLLPAFLTDSLDEVVFEGRNRAYGAYQLRQDYQQHLTSAGGLTVVLLAGLVLGWNIWQALAPAPVVMVPHIVALDPIIPPMQATVEKAKPAVVAPPRPHSIVAHRALTQPTQVTKDELAPPRPATTPVEAVADGLTGPVVPGIAADDAGVAGTAGPASSTTAVATPAPTEPFRYVEKMPEFAGGQEALLRYLRSHLRYPGAALAAGISGRVFMSFVVGADGQISDVTILKGLGYGLDEEALRVICQMPAWTPGYQSKHAVPVRFTLPITFQYQ